MVWLLLFALAQNPPPKVNPRILEDEEVTAPKEYTYNPAQARRELDVGNYYMKKGSHSAAIRRYEEALKWQPNWALPWLKIAQAQEKKEDPGRAAEAYRKYLEALPAKQKDKAASELRRRIERLEREAEKQ